MSDIVDIRNTTNIGKVKLIMLKGEAGNSIKSIEKVDTEGLVDTYEITLTDDTKAYFEVTNGSSIESIEKTATVDLVDTYTITLTDGTTSTFEVHNGANGITRLQSLDFVGKTTTFNADGSISVVADDYTEEITFNADGSITDEVTIAETTTTKTTTFVGNEIIEEIEEE